ncbi:MAG: hypothetical protein ACI835_005313 [Planctomycetota bacterium]|jgi:hypothetical protein
MYSRWHTAWVLERPLPLCRFRWQGTFTQRRVSFSLTSRFKRRHRSRAPWVRLARQATLELKAQTVRPEPLAPLTKMEPLTRRDRKGLLARRAPVAPMVLTACMAQLDRKARSARQAPMAWPDQRDPQAPLTQQAKRVRAARRVPAELTVLTECEARPDLQVLPALPIAPMLPKSQVEMRRNRDRQARGTLSLTHQHLPRTSRLAARQAHSTATLDARRLATARHLL